MMTLLHVFRRAYNLAVEAFKTGEAPSSPLRKRIVDQLKSEYPDHHNYDLCAEAYRKAVGTRNVVIARRRGGKSCEYRLMSWKYSPKYFVLMKFRKEFLKSIVGSIRYAESIPDEAILKVANVVFQDGEWYVCVQQHITVKGFQEGIKRVVALDPGVRTFQTTYSENQAIKYGEMFVQRLTKPMLRLRKLLSERDKLSNCFKAVVGEDGVAPQWFNDRRVWLDRQITKVRAKKSHLIQDLHNRVAYDLVSNYDVILLPTFKTSQMVVKKDDRDRKRKINKKVVRSMLDLCHYRFKLTLKWFARKYGKLVLDVNESYTSKTMCDGTINTKLGSSKVVKLDDGMVADRDEHGARNILIRALTKCYG